MEPENQSAPQTPAAGKSKKGLYIVGGIIVVIVLAKFAFGGLMRTDPAIWAQKGVDGSATYANDQGSVTVGANKLPENWPSDAPVYTKSEIQTAVASNPQTGGAGSAVVFLTSDSAQAVTDFYKKELTAQGWKVEQTVSMGGGAMIAAKKDTRQFGVYITDVGGGKVSVTASIALP